MQITISILGVFLGLHVLLSNIYCYLIACTEASLKAFAKFSFAAAFNATSALPQEVLFHRLHYALWVYLFWGGLRPAKVRLRHCIQFRRLSSTRFITQCGFIYCGGCAHPLCWSKASPLHSIQNVLFHTFHYAVWVYLLRGGLRPSRTTPAKILVSPRRCIQSRSSLPHVSLRRVGRRYSNKTFILNITPLFSSITPLFQ